MTWNANCSSQKGVFFGEYGLNGSRFLFVPFQGRPLINLPDFRLKSVPKRGESKGASLSDMYHHNKEGLLLSGGTSGFIAYAEEEPATSCTIDLGGEKGPVQLMPSGIFLD